MSATRAFQTFGREVSEHLVSTATVATAAAAAPPPPPPPSLPEGKKVGKAFLCNTRGNKRDTSVQLLEVSLLGVGTVLPPPQKGRVVNGQNDY